MSADALPIDKVWDVIGLYLAPPAHVFVVCIDETSQVEAVSAASPRPPRRPRKATEDIDVTDAVLVSELVEVMASTVTDHRYSREQATYGRFLDRIETVSPAHMDVHLVVDNYDPHKAQKIREWMANRPRFQLHLAPTYDAWLDQVDRWFEMPVPGHPKVDEHQSQASFLAAAASFLAAPDDPSKPFVWTKSGDAMTT